MSGLDRLLGGWRFTMQHVAVAEPITGRQEYERVLDGAFVLLRWTYDHPDFPDALAVLSEDSYVYFDVRGVTRVFRLRVEESGWSMERLDESFSQRFSATFDGGDRMLGSGDASDDGGTTWVPDFTITCMRERAPDAPSSGG